MDKLSRRSALIQIGLSAAGTALALSQRAEAAGPPKLPQKAAAYQPTPKGDRKCETCKLFVKPNACEKVDGEISPEGYCILWQKA